jgi:oligopeptide transport system substrate-binding protein
MLNRRSWLFVAALLCATHALAADLDKTLRIAFPVAETGFDPVAVSDLYSNTVLDGVLDAMLSYDYLARPAKLMPNTLEAMPVVSDSGATFTFKVKRGIFFAPDAAFKGKKRELTARDYAYSLKRLFDPQLKSPWLFLLEGKIVGLDDVMQRARQSGKFDYDAPVAGIELLDAHTLRVRLSEPDYNLLYIFAMPTLGALAREVVDTYGADIGSHLVGTGPYYLKDWKRGSRMLLEPNPNYREEYFDGAAGKDAQDEQIVAALKGKRLPIIGQVQITIIDENQPRWLEFLNGNLDLSGVPNEYTNLYVPGGQLAPSLAKRGITLQRSTGMSVTYHYFNMKDPVVGGYTPEKVALRRAISLAYNTAEEILIIRKGQAIPAQSPVPPNVAGYDEAFRNPLLEYNPAKAKALLDQYGYVDRNGDGYRDLPDGKPFELEQPSAPTSLDRQYDELWKKNMSAIGIKVRFKKDKWPELLKQSRAGKLQMKGSAWSADYPDGDNFLQLLYGPNSGMANDARFDLPEFNELYRQARRLPDSPERTKLYQAMTKYVAVYAPWKLGIHPIENAVAQPWVRNYKRNQNILAPWKYLDIETAQRQARR